MGWPRSLVLVRHAESEGNTRSAQERAAYEVATHAYALTPAGEEQARITGEWLRRRFPDGFDTYYSSYYVRARKTLEIMFPGEKRLYVDPRLAEAQRGIFHTYTKEQVAQSFPYEDERKKREGLYHYRPPGGENWPDIELRIHSFLSTLSRDNEGKDVVIVVHGHWLILFQRLIHRFGIEEAERRYREATVPNASVTIYEGRPRSWWKPWRRDALVLAQTTVTPWYGKVKPHPNAGAA